MTEIPTPVIPFAASDQLVHRVSADTTQEWVEDHRGAGELRLLAQCGTYVVGYIKPTETHVVTCIACIGRIVREAVWYDHTP